MRIAQWASILALAVVSELVARAGYTALSLGVDAVAVLGFLGFRRLRR